MKVFKFGGASVKDANAVKNVASILKKYSENEIIVVVSAMAKTTNALELLTEYFCTQNSKKSLQFEEIKKFHFEIIDQLFSDKNHEAFSDVNLLFDKLNSYIYNEKIGTFDFEYDQIVSFGEIISTKIISHYLNFSGVSNKWIDIREFIKTDNSFREGKVDWQKTSELIKTKLIKSFGSENSQKIGITQGFIGSNSDGFTTTLGREGSDYTAAIIAYSLGAENVTIWKDVPGILNADPKYFDETQKLDAISYLEAIELSYYGATILHPKTIKPLQNLGIPLDVKSFVNPEAEGTIISSLTKSDSLIPSFIFKINQVLISISPRDFSFIAEENLSEIFNVFVKHNVKIHLMLNSAVSFSVCIDFDKIKLPLLIADLQKDFKV
ncbi:MAG: aspartate kinase, partial [Bacteroidetes bacterium]|nr:aspartate kinase [Bacteroidota bacterium]